MRRSKVEIYLHFVWTTMRRESWIVEEYEERIHALIANEARAQGAKVLAINGMHDHIHLVVEMPTQVSISKFMQHVKGTSSTIICNTRLCCITALPARFTIELLRA
jgi:putative transposase